jgi:hypothetical protein
MLDISWMLLKLKQDNNPQMSTLRTFLLIAPDSIPSKDQRIPTCLRISTHYDKNLKQMYTVPFRFCSTAAHSHKTTGLFSRHLDHFISSNSLGWTSERKSWLTYHLNESMRKYSLQIFSNICFTHGKYFYTSRENKTEGQQCILIYFL